MEYPFGRSLSLRYPLEIVLKNLKFFKISRSRGSCGLVRSEHKFKGRTTNEEEEEEVVGITLVQPKSMRLKVLA